MRYLRYALLLLAAILPVGGVHAFTDTQDHYYMDAITYVSDRGLMKGYDGDVFRPNAPINRAELAKILMVVHPETKKPLTKTCFADVSKDAWYAPFVCAAKDRGVVSGVAGSFIPDRTVSFVEVAKMITTADGYMVRPVTEGEEWYAPYIDIVNDHGAVPPTVEYVGQPLTRAEVALVLYRLRTKATGDTVNAGALSRTPCTPSGEYTPGATIDMRRVRSEWLSWYNTERAKVGAPALALHGDLSRTASVWAQVAKVRGYIDHKRPGTSAYYDYFSIGRWFRDLGVTFRAYLGSTYGESIAWNVYSCREKDCTDEAISAIRSAYSFFYSEKGRSYRPHYDMMVAKGYKNMGLGVTFDTTARKYYLVAHFGAEVMTDGLPVCSLQ